MCSRIELRQYVRRHVLCSMRHFVWRSFMQPANGSVQLLSVHQRRYVYQWRRQLDLFVPVSMDWNKLYVMYTWIFRRIVSNEHQRMCFFSMSKRRDVCGSAEWIFLHLHRGIQRSALPNQHQRMCFVSVSTWRYLCGFGEWLLLHLSVQLRRHNTLWQLHAWIWWSDLYVNRSGWTSNATVLLHRSFPNVHLVQQNSGSIGSVCMGRRWSRGNI
jgi:hypothetical protein